MSILWSQMDAEVAETPLPAEMRGWLVDVLCNDCGLRSRTSYHVIGHKCGNGACGSYNTTVVGGPHKP